MAALREVYDGSLVRRLGTHGGRTVAWSGKVDLISGVTDGVAPRRVDDLLTKVALDGMSKTRRAIIEYLVNIDRNIQMTSRDVAQTFSLSTNAATRTLEDLAAHGVVQRVMGDGAHRWRASRWLKDRWLRVTHS